MGSSARPGPKRWAADLTIMLNAAGGEDRFPIEVDEFAKLYTRQRWPEDPILDVVGEPLPGFEGALIPAGVPRRGWRILFNTANVSSGRVRFTQAHELAHYLMHRHEHPKGIRCDEKAVTRGGGGLIEQEADTFAAEFLMPLSDLRKRIDPKAKPCFDTLSDCATRYGVSLTALMFRWLGYTERRSLLVVSREGFALYSRSSMPAFRTGRFIRTSGEPFELPSGSCVARGDFSPAVRWGVRHPRGIWFDEDVDELSIHSDTYDQAMTLIHLDPNQEGVEIEEEAEDLVDRFSRFTMGRG